MGALAEGAQFGRSRADLVGERGAGAGDAAESDKRCLAAAGVLGRCLAGGGGVAGGVNEVVSQLERGAERGAIAGKGRPFRLAGAAYDRARLGGVAKQRAGFHRLHLLYSPFVEVASGGAEVQHLAAGHSRWSGRFGEAGDKGSAHAGIGVRRRVGEDREG